MHVVAKVLSVLLIALFSLGLANSFSQCFGLLDELFDVWLQIVKERSVLDEVFSHSVGSS
jgi:hypothetical protein